MCRVHRHSVTYKWIESLNRQSSAQAIVQELFPIVHRIHFTNRLRAIQAAGCVFHVTKIVVFYWWLDCLTILMSHAFSWSLFLSFHSASFAADLWWCRFFNILWNQPFVLLFICFVFVFIFCILFLDKTFYLQLECSVLSFLHSFQWYATREEKQNHT